MGAWGTGVFENDGAGQLLAELRNAAPEGRTTVLREALEYVADGDDYLENPDAQEAIAAAAVVAAARTGGPVGKLDDPEVLGFLVDINPEPDLLRLADRALDRALGAESEWRELWAETPSLDESLAAVAEVRAGLR